MRTVVTGGAGFIGSHLSEKLLNDGHDVTIIDNFCTGQRKNLEKIGVRHRFTFLQEDILNKEKIQYVFKDIDWVFHLAGRADIVPSIEEPELYFQTNVQGTFNVLQCARQAGVKRFIYAASSSSYGLPAQYPTPETAPIAPQYPYALTKYMGEELVMHWAQLYNLPALSLRLFNVYGPRSRTTGAYGAVFGVFLAQKLKHRSFTVVGDGSQTRDFTYVTDVASAFTDAAKSDLKNSVLNVGSGNHYSIKMLVELLGGEIDYIAKRPGEPHCTFADITKIKKLLGWEAKVSFEEGVQKMVEHLEDWNDAPVWTPSTIAQATESWFKYLEK